MNYVLLVKAKPTDFADLPEPVIHPALAAPTAAKLTEVITDCGFSYWPTVWSVSVPVSDSVSILSVGMWLFQQVAAGAPNLDIGRH